MTSTAPSQRQLEPEPATPALVPRTRPGPVVAPRSGGPALDLLHATAGNRAVARLLQPTPAPDVEPAPVEPAASVAARAAPLVQAKLAVSSPADPAEKAADAVATRVMSRAASRPVAAGPPGLVSAQRSPQPEPVPKDMPILSRAAEVGEPAVDQPEVSPTVEALVTSASGGEPLPNDTRGKIEPQVGADLSRVRVHRGPAAASAAASIGARAFTRGPNVFLGSGESPTNLALMAHESTHVVQQGGAAVQRDVIQRLSVADIPGSGIVIDAVRAIPGYRLLAVIIGEDPMTGEAISGGRAEVVQALLGYGPFAGAVGPVLQGLEALDAVFDLVNGRLAEHNLTVNRITGDIAAAWDEMDLAVLDQSPNVAIATRYINGVIADVRAFVAAIVADVLALLREAAVSFVEPLVQKPEIKPIWDLGTKVFHYDPLRGVEVNAPTVEILTDFLTLIGKQDAVAQMQANGTLQQTADWLDTQFATFNDLLGQATSLFADAWNAISPENLPNLIDNLTSLAQRAWALLQGVGTFAWTVVSQVLALIKDALLGLLSEHAHKLPGFHLLTVILGKNPFTGAEVPRTAENLIKGFITLLPNGEATYAQLAESGVIAEAAGKIETAMTELNISWELITGTFKAIWDALSLEDLINPIGAFLRILDQFGEPLGRIVSFVATVVGVVLELILKLMNFPSELLGNVIANARAAIEDIKNDPVKFLMNVVQAMKQGVLGFLDKIGTYLLAGLTDWLFRGLRGIGIEPPKDVSLESIITLVLQVLGLSMETLWTKLGKKIGPEKVAMIRSAIDRLGQAWAFIKDVQERGISAVWEFISGQLSNLWDMILQKAKDWIMTEIIEKVTAKLISMLDPTGIMAVINSCIAFFNAVQSAIEYIREILQIIDKYVSTIAAVARGDVTPGAVMLEQGLAGAVPVAIGFLANQVGLGNVPEKVVEIIQGLRELVDKALDWLFDQAWALGQAALQALGFGQQEPAPAAPEGGQITIAATLPIPVANGPEHHLYVRVEGDHTVLVVASAESVLATFLASQPVEELRVDNVGRGYVDTARKEAAGTSVKADQLLALARREPDVTRLSEENTALQRTEKDLVVALKWIFDRLEMSGQGPVALSRDVVIDAATTEQRRVDALLEVVAFDQESLRPELANLQIARGRLDTILAELRLPEVTRPAAQKAHDQVGAVATELAGYDRDPRIVDNRQRLAAFRAGAQTDALSDRQWDQVKSEMVRILSLFRERIMSVVPATEIGFRGSLARGWKGPQKLTPAGAAKRFDAADFDCDAYIEIPTALWMQEVEPLLPSNDRGLPKFRKLTEIASWRRAGGLTAIENAIIGEIQAVTGGLLAGYRLDLGGRPDFHFFIQSPVTTLDLQLQGAQYPPGAIAAGGAPQLEGQMPVVGGQARFPQTVVKI